MTDKQTPKFINAKRRGFLQGAVVAGGAATTGAALSGEALAEGIEKIDAGQTTGKKGYERTEHVNRYYARARV